MPKKFAENSKKVAGNAKKAAGAASKIEAENQKRAIAEAAEWSKGAKSTAKKDAEAEKKAEAARKKAEKDALLKAELETLKSAKPSASKDKAGAKKSTPTPLPKRGIDAALGALNSPSPETATGGVQDGTVLPSLVATGIDDALAALELTTGNAASTQLDRHPERRIKAAYAAYEERRLPEVKEEYKGLRLNQMKELIRKEFDKSEENPMNQGHKFVRYDATKEEMAAKKAADRERLENRLAAGR